VKTLVDESHELDAFDAYFTTPSTPTDRVVDSLEFTHYNDILRDEQWSDVEVYRAKKETHLANLLQKLMRTFKRQHVDCRL